MVRNKVEEIDKQIDGKMNMTSNKYKIVRELEQRKLQVSWR